MREGGRVEGGRPPSRQAKQGRLLGGGRACAICPSSHGPLIIRTLPASTITRTFVAWPDCPLPSSFFLICSFFLKNQRNICYCREREGKKTVSQLQQPSSTEARTIERSTSNCNTWTPWDSLTRRLRSAACTKSHSQSRRYLAH